MEIFFTSVSAFGISLIAILILNHLALKLRLVDIPNSRKIHNGSIPLVGGIGIFIAVFCLTVYIYTIQSTIIGFLLSILVIILMGGIDDRFDLKVSLRLIVQAISAIILMLGSNLYLEDLGNLLGFGVIHLGAFGIIFTIIAVIAAINAFNMIDGLDGLAGTLSIVSFCSLAALFGVNSSKWMMLSIIFIGAILAYLVFNLKWPIKSIPKVFMGDAGSMLIGVSIIWLLIVGTQSRSPAFNPVTALWIIAIPLMDMASTMSGRIFKGRSPFHADRTHIHHRLLQAGFSSKQTLGIISIASVIYAAIGIIFEEVKLLENYSLILFIFGFICYEFFIFNLKRTAKVQQKIAI